MNIPGACWPARVAKSVSSGFKKTLPQNIRSRATAEDSVDNGHIYIRTHKRKKNWVGRASLQKHHVINVARRTLQNKHTDYGTEEMRGSNLRPEDQQKIKENFKPMCKSIPV